MKKLIAISLVGAVVAGVALASSLSVPFFNDTGDLGPGNDLTSFIGLKNTTDQPIDVAVRYFNAPGQEFTPTDNTFILNPQQGLAFRPFRVDPDYEGPGADFPKMTDGGAGSATVSWEGDPHWVQGRMVQFNANGGWFGYLLPPGF